MADKEKIIVIGAGTVGSHISRLLEEEHREVVLIDSCEEKLEAVGDQLDVQTLCGHACDPAILRTAGVDEAQLVLAMTNIDEVNLLAGALAKKLGAQTTVVRARSPWYLEESIIKLPQSLGIDLILNPEELTAVEIFRFLTDPDVLAMARFAEGRVQIRTLTLDENSPFAGKMVKDCRLPENVLFAVLSHEGEVSIPRGDTALHPGDRVTIMGKPAHFPEAQKLIHAPSVRSRSVTIAGGGITGHFLAEMLERRSWHVKLIEVDADRCDYLSERLDKTQVIHGDTTDVGFLKEERVGSSGVFAGVTGDDETNLMSCLLAKQLGVPETVADIARPDYTELIEELGVSLALSPRHVIASRVLTLLSQGKIRAMTLLEDGKVEVIEMLAESDSPMVGRPLSQLDIPPDVLLGAIVRDGEAIIPRGAHVIEPGDSIVAVGLAKAMDKLEATFRSR